MTYLWLKALHIIAVICWFAGLFYLPRLFVYHASSDDQVSHERFCIMERKLYRGIMHPSLVATVIFAVSMLYMNPALLKMPWMHIKITLVCLLIIYHFSLGVFIKRFVTQANSKTHVFYRWYNELPVLFLLAIVFLAILKPTF